MSVCSRVRQRYVIAGLCYLALMVTYMLRFCIAIILNVMVKPCIPRTSTNYNCPFDQDTDDCSNWMKKQEFSWSDQTQGIILSSFFWGYTVTHLPGGLLADRLGGKYPLGGGIFISALCTLLTPVVTVTCGSWGLVVIRVIMGLGQGVIYPSINSILSKWIPVNERTLVGACVFTGAFCGNILSMLISGMILRHQEDMWQMIFYLFGVLSVIWVAVWMLVGVSCPQPLPGEDEQLEQNSMCSANLQLCQWLARVPWKGMLTSRPVLGLVVAEVGHDWAMFTIIMELPKYMDMVLHLSVWKTGIWTALPYVAMTVGSVMSGWLGHSLTRRKIVAITMLRKIFAAISSMGPALGLIGATYSGCNKGLVNLFMSLAMGLMGTYYSSLKVNCLDLSSNYAGTVMGLVNGLGSFSGIISPFLTSYLIPDKTMGQWRFVFLTSAAILIVTNIIYILLASGEVQPWNTPLPPIQSSISQERVSGQDKKTSEK